MDCSQGSSGGSDCDNVGISDILEKLSLLNGETIVAVKKHMLGPTYLDLIRYFYCTCLTRPPNF